MTGFAWRTRPLGELFDIGAGKSMTPEARHRQPQIPFLRTANVEWGRIVLDEVDSMHLTEDELREKLLRSGDLLVCEGGDIGRAAVWEGRIGSCGFQNHLHRLRRKSDQDDPYFFMYALQAGFTVLGAFEGVGNRTTIPNLSRGRLAALHLPYPDPREQRAVAGLLRQAHEAVQVEERLIVTTRELKQAVMHRLFTRGLRGEEQKETELGLIPQSWSVDTVGSHCEHPEYGVTASATPDRIGPQFLRITDITPLGVDWATVPYCHCSEKDEVAKGLRENDILFARIGATTGKSYIVKTPPRAVFASYLIRLRAKPDTDADFLYYFFNSAPYWAQVDANKKNNLKGGVSGSVLSSLLIPVPQRDEQGEIARILRSIDDMIAAHERKRTALEELFQTLLHDVMTGRLRVTPADVAA